MESRNETQPEVVDSLSLNTSESIRDILIEVKIPTIEVFKSAKIIVRFRLRFKCYLYNFDFEKAQYIKMGLNWQFLDPLGWGDFFLAPITSPASPSDYSIKY